MTNFRAVALWCGFSLLLVKSASPFTPPGTLRAVTKGKVSSRWRFRSEQLATRTTTDSQPKKEYQTKSDDKTIASKEVLKEESKDIAIEALEKLLARQKSEIQATEQMIEELRSNADTNQDLSKVGGLPASVLAGFDYGFVSRSEGVPLQDLTVGLDIATGESIKPQLKYGPPSNVATLSYKQFFRNLNAMRGEYFEEEPKHLTLEQKKNRKLLETLTLDVDTIWQKEKQSGQVDNAPLLVKIPYIGLCWFLDFVFEGKYVPARFFLLETVARMPYFSYITCLHLYETLGFWRQSADLKRVHMAQEINEFHHLMIMESLGGDQKWWVRAMAQHSAIAYYIGLCILWLISPTLSYTFSELLEGHAVNTYGQFLEENEETLKTLPPSLPAIEYYALGASDPFLAEYQTTALAEGGSIRRSGYNMTTLFDVFTAIKADEGDHVSTMVACIEPDLIVRSASLEKKLLAGAALAAFVSYYVSSGGESVNFDASLTDQLFNDVESAEGVTGSIETGLEGLTPSFELMRVFMDKLFELFTKL